MKPCLSVILIKKCYRFVDFRFEFFSEKIKFDQNKYSTLFSCMSREFLAEILSSEVKHHILVFLGFLDWGRYGTKTQFWTKLSKEEKSEGFRCECS